MAEGKFRPNLQIPFSEIAQYESTGRELSFEWSHHRISSADSKGRVTLQNSIKHSGSERVSLIQCHPTTCNCYLNSTKHSIWRDHICCYSIIKYQRALDLRTRTSTCTRFDLSFCAFSKKDIQESLKKLVRLFILKEVKPSRDRKIIKLFTFDNLFPPLRHSRLNW